MSHQERRDERERERIGDLITAAGARPEMPRARLEEIREGARSSWRASLEGETEGGTVGRFPQRAEARPGLWGWALAASVIAVALVVAWWLRGPGASGGDAEEQVAGLVVHAVGVVRAEGAAGDRSVAIGDQVQPGTVFEAGPEGVLALRVGDGSLRVASSSRVEVRSEQLVVLERGALYFDSGDVDSAGTADAAAIRVRTRWGTVEDVGTQFEVRVLRGAETGDTLRVRVREGAVILEGPGLEERAGEGTELTVGPEGKVGHGVVTTSGAAWSWILDAAPPFDPEEQTLGALLDWIERETGWSVRFENPADAALRSAVLHGPVVERPDRGFDDLLAANGLVGEPAEGELVLRAAQ